MHKIQRKIRRHKQLPRVRSQSIARPDVKDASMAILPAEPRKLRVWSRISDQEKINIFINVFSIVKIRCFTIALALHFQYDVLQLMSSTLSFTQIIIQVNNDGEVPGRLFAHDDQYYLSHAPYHYRVKNSYQLGNINYSYINIVGLIGFGICNLVIGLTIFAVKEI